MAAISPVAAHGAEYLRILDAKDDAGILGLMTEDAQVVDEITRRWYRGKHEIGVALREVFSRLSDVHSTAEDMHSVRWGDVEVETFLLHQAYELDESGTSVVVGSGTGVVVGSGTAQAVPFGDATFKAANDACMPILEAAGIKSGTGTIVSGRL